MINQTFSRAFFGGRVCVTPRLHWVVPPFGGCISLCMIFLIGTRCNGSVSVYYVCMSVGSALQFNPTPPISKDQRAKKISLHEVTPGVGSPLARPGSRHSAYSPFDLLESRAVSPGRRQSLPSLYSVRYAVRPQPPRSHSHQCQCLRNSRRHLFVSSAPNWHGTI